MTSIIPCSWAYMDLLQQHTMSTKTLATLMLAPQADTEGALISPTPEHEDAHFGNGAEQAGAVHTKLEDVCLERNTAAPTPSAARASGTRATTRPVGEGPQPRASRWKRDKSKLGGLEQQLAEQQRKARQLEQEQQKLRLRNVALEHAIASREWQLGILQTERVYRPSEQHLQHGAAAVAAALKEFVKNASTLLLELSDSCDSEMDQPILSRISDLVAELQQVLGSAYVLNHGIHYRLIASHLDAPPSAAAEQRVAARPDDRHWEQVAKEIAVTPRQLDEIAACWDFTNEAMAWLQQEATKLSQELAAALQNSQPCALFDIANRLSTLEYKQGVIYRGFCFAILFRIMSPFHVARTMVQSFPYYIDTRELVRKLMQMHGLT